MSIYFNKNVAYLENQDFDASGKLINSDIPSGVPVVVYTQASWCPNCTNAKPAFQAFADKHKNAVFCATIQSDGDRESEKKLGERISSIKPSFRGFPDYLLFVDGKLVDKEIAGRDVQHIESFCGL